MKYFFGLTALLLTMASYEAKGSTIDKIAEEVTTEKVELQRKEIQKRNILGDLYSVNKNLKLLNGDKSKIEKKLKQAEQNVSSLSEIINQLDQKIKKQRIRLRERMKSISKMQGQGAARVVFGSQSAGALDANLRLFRIITEKDIRLIKSFRENVRVYKAQKSNLSFQEQKYAKLKQSLDQKEKYLAEQLSKKNNMLKTIDSSRLLHLAKLKKLKLNGKATASSENELRKISALEELFAPQMFEQKGSLIRPVDGTLVKGFGLYDDAESGTKIRFKGNLFKTTKKSAVKSVFNGKVVYAGWLDGYGLTVIIDHGDQYFSVYGNQSSLEVSSGDHVSTGSVLGYTGETVSFLGKGIYFELRHFSEPEDPAEWIKGS